jgi:hypothetical protein
VTGSTIRIRAEPNVSGVADVAFNIQIALLVTIYAGLHGDNHVTRNGIIPVPRGSMAIAAREVLRRTVYHLSVGREQFAIWQLIRHIAVAEEAVFLEVGGTGGDQSRVSGRFVLCVWCPLVTGDTAQASMQRFYLGGLNEQDLEVLSAGCGRLERILVRVAGGAFA